MKKRSIWVLLGLLVAALTLGLVGCGGEEDKTEYKLSETQIELTVGQTKALTISPEPNTEVTWTSADAAVATVAGGTVTAVKEGSTKVTAQIAGVETPLSCNVTVKAAQQQGNDGAKGYALNFTTLAMKTGETKQLAVSDKDGNAVTAGVSYKSGNTAIATVSETGLVSAVATGETAITVTVSGETLTCNVTVAQTYAFSLEPASLDIAAGATAGLTLKATPELPAGGRPHTFTSSDPAVATVDGGSGLVTGVAKGTAVITCAVDGEEVKANVTVTEYTVKIGNEAMGAETALRVGEPDKQITITADPAEHPINATYATSNEGVVTVTDGLLHAVAAGTATVTVTVGGREFATTVTVTSQVQYTLKAGGEPIADDTVTLKLGETLQLSIERDPAGEIPATTYDSEDANVAQAGSDGLITAKGVGTTTVTVAIAGADTFEITVNVLYEVQLTEVDYPSDSDKASVNLDALDEKNVTLDWRYYGQNDYTDRKKGASLIGDIDGYAQKASDFYDYRVGMSWTDGTTTAQSLSGRYDGITFKQTVNFDVKVTKDVKYIAVFTGAWHATNTVSISYNGMVCASKTFTNNGGAGEKNKQIIFTPDQENFVGTEMTFTVTLKFVGDGENSNNISLVAIAVVGNAEREETVVSATAETPEVKALANETRNLSLIGTEDWIYAKNGNDGDLVRRSGVENVILENEIQYTGGGGTDWLQEAFGRFNWYEQDCAQAVDNGSVNNTHWTDGTWSVPIHLTVGKHIVTLYLTGWKASYFVTVLDGSANIIINAHQAVTGNGQNNQAVEVKIALDVTKEDTFIFRMSKEGDGNHGWAAVAVGYATEYTLEKTEFDVTLDGTDPGSVVVKKGDETYTTELSFSSDNSGVVTVDQSDGKLTAAGKGRAIVTVTIGNVKLRAFITVTEYTLKSPAEVTIPLDGTSQIEIEADPVRTVTAEYKVTEGDTYAEVSEQGVITAKEAGTATVTATVGGKVFTITVNVVSYKLNKEEIVLTLGSENATDTLEMQQNDGVKVEGVKFSSDDDKIASVHEETGVITAVGFGETIVKAKKDGTVLECEVTVKLKVDTSATKDYENGSDETVNLDELDETNVTLDWRYFGRDKYVEEMKDGDLIGEVNGVEQAGDFYDYRAKINWINGTQFAQSYLNRTDGVTYKKSVSITVKVTKDVKYISVFTGAWHAKNTITISYNGVEYASVTFSNDGKGNGYEDGDDTKDKNKQIIFAPDMANFGEEEKMFTITITCGENMNKWADNISFVAVAVVGNTVRGQRPAAAGIATENHTLTSNGETVDLTEVGTLDWMYVWDDTKGVAEKTDGNAIASVYSKGEHGGGGDHFEKQKFKWSDGTHAHDGADTDFFRWVKDPQSVSVTLSQKAVVTLWVSAWKDDVRLVVYDAAGNVLIEQVTVISGNGENSQGVKVEVTIDVKTPGAFTFVFDRVDKGGNYGLGAVAVANAEAD